MVAGAGVGTDALVTDAAFVVFSVANDVETAVTVDGLFVLRVEDEAGRGWSCGGFDEWVVGEEWITGICAWDVWSPEPKTTSSHFWEVLTTSLFSKGTLSLIKTSTLPPVVLRGLAGSHKGTSWWISHFVSKSSSLIIAFPISTLDETIPKKDLDWWNISSVAFRLSRNRWNAFVLSILTKAFKLYSAWVENMIKA
jgi:hypothetical protein